MIKLDSTTELQLFVLLLPDVPEGKCPGNPSYFETEGRKIKICTECTFPHVPEHYDTIIEILSKRE